MKSYHREAEKRAVKVIIIKLAPRKFEKEEAVIGCIAGDVARAFIAVVLSVSSFEIGANKVENYDSLSLA